MEWWRNASDSHKYEEALAVLEFKIKILCIKMAQKINKFLIRQCDYTPRATFAGTSGGHELAATSWKYTPLTFCALLSETPMFDSTRGWCHREICSSSERFSLEQLSERPFVRSRPHTSILPIFHDESQTADTRNTYIIFVGTYFGRRPIRRPRVILTNLVI